jgi:glycolate oxidase FAD binding subunit
MTLGIEIRAAEASIHPVLGEWRERILAAATRGGSLRIAGGGSKAFYGRRIDGEPLDTRAYSGVIAYEPTELVITARCGTPLSEIDAILDEHGQMLAFEPPHFAGSPTIGGVVAAGLSGPRRMAAGAVRDFVLGARLLDGKGELLSFGGQVMKNVAGYDVSRLLAGSLGCLGVLAELSLKVVPRPRRELTLRFALAEGEALGRLNRWAGQPLPLSASAWFDGVLHVRLSGAGPSVDAARRKLGGDEVDETAAADFWRSLRDQSHPFFAPAGGDLIRLALPDTTPAIALPGPHLIEWGGAQRWCRAPVERLSEIRALAAAHGGHATLFRAAAGSAANDVFAPLAAPLLRIHRALKHSLDPAGVFNRGRMYPEV